MKPKEKGNRGEDLACTFLADRGYRIKERNFWARTGEIDIVAYDGETLVFVEVRYRQAGSMVSACESVDPRKVRRMLSAAKWYLSVRGVADNVAVRFDLVVAGEGEVPCDVIQDII